LEPSDHFDQGKSDEGMIRRDRMISLGYLFRNISWTRQRSSLFISENLWWWCLYRSSELSQILKIHWEILYCV